MADLAGRPVLVALGGGIERPGACLCARKITIIHEKYYLTGRQTSGPASVRINYKGLNR